MCDIEVVTLVLTDPDYEIMRFMGKDALRDAEALGLVLRGKLHADEIAERVRNKISEQPLQPQSGESLPVTISIGIAMLPNRLENDGHTTAQNLISQADTALYLAKENGRNRVISAWTLDDLNLEALNILQIG